MPLLIYACPLRAGLRSPTCVIVLKQKRELNSNSNWWKKILPHVSNPQFLSTSSFFQLMNVIFMWFPFKLQESSPSPFLQSVISFPFFSEKQQFHLSQFMFLNTCLVFPGKLVILFSLQVLCNTQVFRFPQSLGKLGYLAFLVACKVVVLLLPVMPFK